VLHFLGASHLLLGYSLYPSSRNRSFYRLLHLDGANVLRRRRDGGTVVVKQHLKLVDDVRILVDDVVLLVGICIEVV